MAYVAVPALFASGLSGDASIVFWAISMLGLPAWLIVAGLSLARRLKYRRSVVVVQNAPAILAAIVYAAVHIQWATK